MGARIRRYGIRRYLTDRQKRSMLAASYQDTRVLDGEPAPRDADGYCPLGLITGTQNPSSEAVEYELSRYGTSRTIRGAAARFIRDWDSGKLRPADLAEALA